MRLAVITPTGGHKGCLAVCAKRVQEQTIKCLWMTQEGLDWYANVTALICRASDEGMDGVVIFDDDDWYPPDYCQWMLDSLSVAPMAGHRRTKIYHLPAAAWNELTPRGPLPGTMGFRSDLYKAALKLLARRKSVKDLFLDLTKAQAVQDGSPIVSVKGIPDRPNLAVKHEYTPGRFPNPDPDRSKLRSWVGDEAANDYLDML